MIMDYSWENLNSREFEIIACNYANDIFSKYIWSLTKSTRDDNHDFLAFCNNLDKWGEAKHSETSNKLMSRTQWDPTIVSAKLVNCVNEILLVTCANIPLTYVIRSFHMIDKKKKKIFYINRFLLNNWYSGHPNLRDLDNKYPVINIADKLTSKHTTLDVNSHLNIFIFDFIENNFLTPKKEICVNGVYELDIVIFVAKNGTILNIPNDKYIGFTSKIIVNNLSFPDCCRKVDANNDIQLILQQGYNIIKANIIVKNEKAPHNTVYLKVLLNSQIFKKEVKVCNAPKIENSRIIHFEKELNLNKTSKNRIINIDYLPIEKFSRNNKNYFFIRFDKREYYNYSKLCRMIIHMITNIDFYKLDESVLRQTIIKYNNYEIIEDFIVGIFDSLIAYECFNNNLRKNFIIQLLSNQQKSQNCFYIIENSSFLKRESYNLLKEIESYFSLYNNNNVIIYQDYERNDKQSLKINDDIAKVVFIENGVFLNFLQVNVDNPYNGLICEDVEKHLAFPDYKIEVSQIITYLCSKDQDSLSKFFESISYIIDKQSWSNRALDVFILLNDMINPKVCLFYLRKIRNIYYYKTDFWTAYGYSKLINQLHTVSSIDLYIDDLYKEADELNHCGSITASREKFKSVVELIDSNNLDSYQSMKLEAITEIYNISFWLLDTKNLIESINKTITEYFPNGIQPKSSVREQYPYYNCLNRKMVTEYLLELYDEAEMTFQLCIKESKLKNYIAFAYMDSARGLYKKDINTAYQRIKIAYKILKGLHSNGYELRRFFDCSVEKSYLEFILSDASKRKDKINELQDRIYDTKKHGYKSILKKCYFKLAACYIVLENVDKAKYYLDIISSDNDFDKSPRNQLMYNKLNMVYYFLLNEHFSFYHCNNSRTIDFNCFENDKIATIYVETRLW